MKQRIITALIMVVIFLPIAIIGGIPFYCLIAIAVGWGMFEIMRATEGNISKDSIATKCMSWPTYLIALSVVLTMLGALYPYFYNLLNGNGFVFSEIQIPIIPFVLLTFSLFTGAVFNQNVDIIDVFLVIAMSMFLMIGGQSIAMIRDMGWPFIVFALLTCFVTDMGAYFVGSFCTKRFETHKLNERISPKKTIEGSIGGTILGTLIPFLITLIPSMNLKNDNLFGGVEMEWWFVLLVAFIMSLTAQVGDLTFSAIKRHFDIKDYSQIFPGHGGVLDRLDSILFNMIFFAVIIMTIVTKSIF